MIITWAILIVCLFLFFLQFEVKKVTARDITLIAALTAISVVGRIIFAPIPSAQPTSFMIITASTIFGPQVGMLVGALSAFVSNMFLGQGPWTPWQMLSWSLMGLVAGLIFYKLKVKSKTAKILYGVISGIVFGVIMDMWFVSAYLRPFNIEAIVLGLSAGVPFNIIHGVTNGVFIALFTTKLEKILERVRIKYGVLKSK